MSDLTYSELRINGVLVPSVTVNVSRQSMFESCVGKPIGAVTGTMTMRSELSWLEISSILLGKRIAWDMYMRTTLWTRVRYGGRKGARAFRRLFSKGQRR